MIRKALKLISIVIVFLTILSVTNIQPTLAQDNQLSNKERAWNAGACILDLPDGYGQCYLAVDPESDTGLSVFTIHHVTRGASEIHITVPTLVDNAEVQPNRFSCNRRSGDRDTACHFDVTDRVAREVLSGDTNVLPYIRLHTSRYLRVGQYVASPRPDTGRWTIYIITDFNDEDIFLEAIFIEVQGRAVPLGNFCHGRSGAPIVPITLHENGSIDLMYSQGYPISLGELERANGPEVRDYVDSSNGCSYYVATNRVED